jgi:uncharacterized membrane protein YfcA
MAASASLTTLQLLLIAPAAVLAGAVNAVAGGGSLISFPALTAVGLPPLMANVTTRWPCCQAMAAPRWPSARS